TELTPNLLLDLQRLVINQIYTCAGTFRDGPVKIAGVKHEPPHHSEVSRLVDGMCRYVNQSWGKSPVHLSAYLMWRVNWIHPFFGGTVVRQERSHTSYYAPGSVLDCPAPRPS